MITDDTRFLVPEHVLVRKVGDELVILNLESEAYFGVDDIGAAFVEALRDNDFASAVELLVSTFNAAPERIRQDCAELAASMVDAGLLASK